MDDGSKGKLKDEAVSVNKSSSLKRPRQRSMNGTQIASCLVDGCNADLSKCRDYHRRHKVCELHSKTSKVTINGEERRFCQQCSRFHSLGEFDEGKRSCRRRLDGHNKRRRKPQLEPISTNVGRFLSSYQGTILCPTNYAWGGAVKPENCAAIESNGALSLLSLTPAAAKQDTGFSHTGHSSAIGPGPSQSLIPRLPYEEFGLMEDEAAVSNFMSDGSSSASLLQCQGMFQNSDYAS